MAHTRRRSRVTRGTRFGNSDAEPLTTAAQKAQRLVLIKEMKGAIKKANANLHKTLKPTYFQHIPLGDIYKAVESTGLAIPDEERNCILAGHQGRAAWPLTYGGLAVPQHLWISWFRMESGKLEVIGAVT